jgi:pimeloyl-ACP methyl ester carboxylesterase
MALVPINGGKLNTFELNPWGDDPIIMTHGMYMSLAAFFFTLAPPLAREHRVILYDLRSHGRSDWRDEGYAPEMLSEDLLQLMDALDIPQASLVAYSYGGTSNLHLALHHPERVKRLALIETVFVNENTYHTLLGNDDSTEHLNQDLEGYTAATGLPVPAFQANRMRALNLHIFEEGRAEVMFVSNQRLVDEVARGQLGVPTLLVYGDESPFLDMGQMLESAIPETESYIVPGDHNLLVQQGEQLARYLQDFLRPA